MSKRPKLSVQDRILHRDFDRSQHLYAPKNSVPPKSFYLAVAASLYANQWNNRGTMVSFLTDCLKNNFVLRSKAKKIIFGETEVDDNYIPSDTDDSTDGDMSESLSQDEDEDEDEDDLEDNIDAGYNEEEHYLAPGPYDQRRHTQRQKKVARIYRNFNAIEEKKFRPLLREVKQRNKIEKTHKVYLTPRENEVTMAIEAGFDFQVNSEIDFDAYEERLFNLVKSTLTVSELEFVMDNAAKLDFCVNVYSLRGQQVFPVTVGIGSPGTDKVPKRKNVVHLLRVLLAEDPIAEMEAKNDDSERARFLDELINASKVDSISSYREKCQDFLEELEGSRGTEERKKYLKLFGKPMKISKEIKEDLKDIADEVVDGSGVFYFSIHSPDLFFATCYNNEEKMHTSGTLGLNLKAKYCYYCMQRFGSVETLNNHLKVCNGKLEIQRECLPRDNVNKYKETFKEFNKMQNKEKPKLIGFVDFEAINNSEICPNCQLKEIGISSRCKCEKAMDSELENSLHIPVMACLLIINGDGDIIEDVTLSCGNTNEEALKFGCQKVVQHLINIEEKLLSIMHRDLQPPKTQDDYDSFFAQTRCVICYRDFDFKISKYYPVYKNGLASRQLLGQRAVATRDDTDTEDRIVWHHDHHYGRWIGPAHK